MLCKAEVSPQNNKPITVDLRWLLPSSDENDYADDSIKKQQAREEVRERKEQDRERQNKAVLGAILDNTLDLLLRTQQQDETMNAEEDF